MTHARSIEIYSNIQFKAYGLLKFVFFTYKFACILPSIWVAATHHPKIFTSTAHILCNTTSATTIPVMTVPDGGVGSGDTCVGDDTGK